MLQLINDILDLSKIEAGRMELCYQDFDLKKSVANISRDLEEQASRKGLQLVQSIPDQELILCGDATKCGQVIRNLLSNAIKYTDHGQVEISLIQRVDSELGPVAEIRVKDTGVGIREEDRERIFQRFSQVDESSARKVGGTGLGLVITLRFVELHGGRLDLESEFGAGSVFTATIPVTPSAGRRAAHFQSSPRPEQAADLPAASPQPLPGVASSVSAAKSSDDLGVTTLCVDDEPDILNFLGLTMRDAGYTVAQAGNYEQALEQASAHQPDLICLDLQLEGPNGYEILASLKASPEFAVFRS